jgi:hypothetical protein
MEKKIQTYANYATISARPTGGQTSENSLILVGNSLFSLQKFPVLALREFSSNALISLGFRAFEPSWAPQI